MKITDTRKVTTDDLGSTRGATMGTQAIANAGRTDKVEGAEADQVDIREPELSPLFSEDTEREFRGRWTEIQSGFVDEPRHAVEQADELVAELMQKLAQSFSEQRSGLERQWEKSDKVSTEELRLALRRYRSFFERLLSI
jgi:CHAD domain-containing protein